MNVAQTPSSANIASLDQPIGRVFGISFGWRDERVWRLGIGQARREDERRKMVETMKSACMVKIMGSEVWDCGIQQ